MAIRNLSVAVGGRPAGQGFRLYQPRQNEEAPLVDPDSDEFRNTFMQRISAPREVSQFDQTAISEMPDAFGASKNINAAVAGDPLAKDYLPAEQPSWDEARQAKLGAAISSGSQPENLGTESFNKIHLDTTLPDKDTWQTTPGGKLVEARAREAQQAQKELNDSSDSASSWWSVLLAAMFPQYGQAISMMHGLKAQKFRNAMDKYNATYWNETRTNEPPEIRPLGGAGSFYSENGVVKQLPGSNGRPEMERVYADTPGEPTVRLVPKGGDYDPYVRLRQAVGGEPISERASSGDTYQGPTPPRVEEKAYPLMSEDSFTRVRTRKSVEGVEADRIAASEKIQGMKTAAAMTMEERKETARLAMAALSHENQLQLETFKMNNRLDPRAVNQVMVDAYRNAEYDSQGNIDNAKLWGKIRYGLQQLRDNKPQVVAPTQNQPLNTAGQQAGGSSTETPRAPKKW